MRTKNNLGRASTGWLLLVALMTTGFLGACKVDALEEIGERGPSYRRTVDSHTILFIHGMYLTPKSWTAWDVYFRELGYVTLSPPWPEHERSVGDQNAMHPNAALAELTFRELVDHYRQIVLNLDEKPIVVGHSMGGLIAQILLEEDLVAAAIAIHSAPPFGVITAEPKFLRANAAVLDLSVPVSQPLKMTLEQFRFGFANGMTPEEQEEAYRSYVVPESRRMALGAITPAAAIDGKVARPPLLLIAGGKDNTATATLNYKNFEHYQGSPSITDFKQFPNRNHWTIGAPGWEEVADYVQRWILKSKQPVVTIALGAPKT